MNTGEVVGDCMPSHNGAAFVAFLKKAVAPHAGREIHVLLDNLSTHTTPVGQRRPSSTNAPEVNRRCMRHCSGEIGRMGPWPRSL
nr:hypothetical protein [Micromonospora inositola]